MNAPQSQPTIRLAREMEHPQTLGLFDLAELSVEDVVAAFTATRGGAG